MCAAVRHIVPAMSALNDPLGNWFTDIIDSAKEAIGNGIDSVMDAAWSALAWSASDQGRAMIAGIAQSQTDFIMHPTMERLVTFLSTYGPIIASAVIPGAGWVLAAALLARGLISGNVSIAETIGKVIVQVYPQSAFIVELVNKRGEGLREMLLSAALSSMPPEIATIVAFARNPRGALTEYALGLLPEDARGWAQSALNGTLKQDALSAALGAMPPEVAAAVACAQDPKGTLAAWAIDRLPPDLQQWARDAVSGDLDRSLVATMLQRSGAAQPLMALAFAAEDLRDYAGTAVAEWRDKAQQYTKDLDTLKARYNTAHKKAEDMEARERKRLEAISSDFAENNRIIVAENLYAKANQLDAQYADLKKAALAHAAAVPDIKIKAEAQMALDLKNLSAQVATTTAALSTATKRGDALAAQVKKATAELATAKASAEAAIKRGDALAAQVKKATADLAIAKTAQAAADKARAAAVAAVATAKDQATKTKAAADAALAKATQQVAAAKTAQQVAEKARAAAEASAAAAVAAHAAPARLSWLQWYTEAA